MSLHATCIATTARQWPRTLQPRSKEGVDSPVIYEEYVGLVVHMADVITGAGGLRVPKLVRVVGLECRKLVQQRI